MIHNKASVPLCPLQLRTAPHPGSEASAGGAAPGEGHRGHRASRTPGGVLKGGKPWENREKTMGKGWFFMGFMGFLASG